MQFSPHLRLNFGSVLVAAEEYNSISVWQRWQVGKVVRFKVVPAWCSVTILLIWICSKLPRLLLLVSYTVVMMNTGDTLEGFIASVA